MTNIEKMLKYCHDTNDGVYIYGAGIYGKRLACFLQQKNIRIQGFIETRRAKGMFRGIPICNASEIEWDKNLKILVGVSHKYTNEIIDVLRIYGYAEEFIVTENMNEYVRKNVDYSIFLNEDKAKSIQVLLFHRVTYKEYDPWRLEVRPERFEEYIRYIVENYPVVRFEDDWSQISEKSICITFDDGYWDNFEYALPILEKYQVPATIFVCSGNIGTEREFWWDRLTRLIPESDVPSTRDYLKKLSFNEREMELEKIEEKSFCKRQLKMGERSVNIEELKRMADSKYVSIGAHTITHTALAFESKEEQFHEISQSKSMLEKAVGGKVTTFSYPFGGIGTYSDETIQILIKCGFEKAASNFPGLVDSSTDLYQIPRYAQPERNLREFKNSIEEIWYLNEA